MSPDTDLPPLFAEAGARVTTDTIPDQIDIEWLRSSAARLEEVLRLQFDDRILPPAWEARLAAISPTTMRLALRRWKFVNHFYLLWQEGSRGGEAKAETALKAAYKLAHREPVIVEISGGRRVRVTDRSLAQLVEIARHAARIRQLLSDLERVREVEDRLIEQLTERTAETERADLTFARRRLQWIRDIRIAMLRELTRQRQAIYAHAFRADGKPAESRHEAPDWWDEVTVADDAKVIAAVNEAGLGRVAEMGEPPKPPKPKEKGKGAFRYLEQFDWMSPLVRWGVKIPIEPAELFDQPLGRAYALMRISADPVWDDNA